MDLEDPVRLLHRLYGGWHAGVGGALERLEAATVDVRHLVEVPALPSYVRERTVLVGDAAHAMAPHLGRGAGEALVDAAALAECLSAAPDVATGLAAYDRARRVPTRRVVTASRLVGRLATAEHLTGVREALLAGAGRLVR